MNKIFDLENYKKYLIDYYVENYDKNTYEKRAYYINSFYSNIYLYNILEGTKQFISYLLYELESKSNDNKVFCIIKMPSFDELGRSRTSHISNNCIGGWTSDTIIKPTKKNDLLVSMYLLKKFFGPDFLILIDNYETEEIEKMNFGAIYSICANEKLTIIGTTSNLEKLYKKYNIEKPKVKSLVSKKTQ